MMIDNFKLLGLALAIVLTLSVAITSMASGQTGKLTSDGASTLIGEETGVEQNGFTLFGLRRTLCPGSVYTGHKYNVTPHTLIPSGETTVTLTSHPAMGNHGCLVPGFSFRERIDLNGCDYVLHLGSTTGGVAGTYGITFDIVCPAGQSIALTDATNTTSYTENKFFCVLHILPQTGLPGGHATDTGNGHIDLSGSITGIKAVQTASASHPVLCPVKETNAAVFDFDLTLKGRNSSGGATPISVSEF
jgi:hypothetical protein